MIESFKNCGIRIQFFPTHRYLLSKTSSSTAEKTIAAALQRILRAISEKYSFLTCFILKNYFLITISFLTCIPKVSASKTNKNAIPKTNNTV